MSYVAKMNSQH